MLRVAFFWDKDPFEMPPSDGDGDVVSRLLHVFRDVDEKRLVLLFWVEPWRLMGEKWSAEGGRSPGGGRGALKTTIVRAFVADFRHVSGICMQAFSKGSDAGRLRRLASIN